MPKQSTHTAAQVIHIQATDVGHAIVWGHNSPAKSPNGSSLATGYIGRCTNPNCKIKITVDDDDSDALTQPEPLPPCPLNTQR